MGLPNFRATARLFLHWTSRNVGGPAWYGDYQNDVAYAGYFNDQAVYCWNLMDVVQPSDLDYVLGQTTTRSAIATPTRTAPTSSFVPAT